jgi:hypothetical protein
MLMLSFVLAALLLLLDDTFGVSDSIHSLIFPRALAPASSLFYFQTKPSWGTISLDGHRLAHLPQVGTESPLQLTKGTHQVVWQTEPFPSMTCSLIVPPVQGLQTCPVYPVIHPNRFTPSALVATPPKAFSLHLLAPGQQQALMLAAQEQLDTLQSTDIVQAGEVYRSNASETAVKPASRPLQASLRFLLDTDTSRAARCQGITLSQSGDPLCFIAQNDCRLFCTIEWPTNGATDTQPYWDVAAIVRTLRMYIPPETETPPQGESTETQQFVAFRIGWDQETWHVSFHQQGESFFDDPNCHDMISTLVTDPRYQNTTQSHWTYTSGSNRAQGCVAVMRPNDSTQVSSTPPETILLERFGVLLAASPTASQRWPELPKASEHERDHAKEIIGHPAFVS